MYNLFFSDSQCSEWSEWDFKYDSPCEDDAKFSMQRNHSKNCTIPLFGGIGNQCQIEHQLKYANILEIAETFQEAEGKCNQVGQQLFTWLFWFYGGLIKWSCSQFHWTGFEAQASSAEYYDPERGQ